MVEMVRARKAGARVLVIEDECEGMNSEIPFRRTRLFLGMRSQGGWRYCCSATRNLAASVLSDNYIIFRRGRVVKGGGGIPAIITDGQRLSPGQHHDT